MKERDLAEWDREIEADFQRVVAATRSTGKRERKTDDPFAIVPLGWAAKVGKAAGVPALIVCVHLIYAAWQAKGKAFPLSNVAMPGVNRETKRRILRKLEKAKLITVKWGSGRSPIVTLQPPRNSGGTST